MTAKSTTTEKKTLDRRRQLQRNKKKPKIEHSPDDGDDEDDRISKLPEEILVRVVSLLPLRDAVATSALSRPWRSVWTHINNLNFGGDQIVKPLNTGVYFDFGKLRSERSRFIEWVNGVINQHVGDIDRFRVYFDLDRTSTTVVDRWIKFAMERRVKVLELELRDYGCPRQTEAYILRREVFGHDNSVAAFRSLKVLDLRSLTVDGELIEYLLSKCPILERLRVTMSTEVGNLRVHGPSLALKHLTLYNCQGIKSVEIIDAKNLVSFYFDCFKRVLPLNLVVRNVPMLVDVYLHIHDVGVETCVPLVFNMLSCCVSQLQILQVKIAYQTYVKNPVYPILPNLKELKLVLSQLDYLNLLRIISFMEVSPYLQRLVLKLKYLKRPRGRLRKLMKPLRCPCLHHLKELEVLGYSSTAIELVVYFIKNAVSLQKIVINPCIYKYEWSLSLPKYSKDIEQEQMARDHALKHLKNKVPSNIEFICL